ncbi:MAG: hypothetical protein M0R33_17065 [Methylomonas sp.]|jgi:hypothetical protein|uniref:hypothetical protein n=1 Tax=Methylomonas sp. TaxID=418 RepID=UPI0025EE75A4|nr:hypothetical protein [Methylomonas sp.]MCK9608157.1 hypothetical protein [Methylomonas sp.]
MENETQRLGNGENLAKEKARLIARACAQNIIKREKLEMPVNTTPEQFLFDTNQSLAMEMMKCTMDSALSMQHPHELRAGTAAALHVSTAELDELVQRRATEMLNSAGIFVPPGKCAAEMLTLEMAASLGDELGDIARKSAKK